jgi:uncharacterized protein YoaH (UPF0181 family)
MKFLTHLEVNVPVDSPSDDNFKKLRFEGRLFDVRMQGTKLDRTQGMIQGSPELIEDPVKGPLHKWTIRLYETDDQKKRDAERFKELTDQGMSAGFAAQIITYEKDVPTKAAEDNAMMKHEEETDEEFKARVKAKHGIH